MLQIHSNTFNPYQENTYCIINHAKKCWIVDPGMYEEREKKFFSDFIERNGLIPQAIINTHAHPDHIFGVKYLQELYNIPFYLHKNELPIMEGAAAFALMSGFDKFEAPIEYKLYDSSTTLQLDEDEVTMLFTPGHSPGSVSFYDAAGKWLIGGDVLFMQSIGRTDLPGGDYNTLINSINTQLLPLPDDTVVYSGHGPSTLIGSERRGNPFLQ